MDIEAVDPYVACFEQALALQQCPNFDSFDCKRLGNVVDDIMHEEPNTILV